MQIEGAPTGEAPGWLEACFVPEACLRVRLAVRARPGAGEWRRSSPRCAAGSTSTPRPEALDAALAGLPGAPGLRLPGSVDGFELAVRAVLGQQVTIAGARTLARRLVERFGSEVATPWSDVHRAFPAPEQLAAAPIERIAELGIIRTRVGAIQALAQHWPTLTPLIARGGDPERLVERLRELPGIGAWTAHYVAMRALGWPDAFPPGDVAALKAMQRLFATSSAREAESRAAAWRPWRSYALLRLWNSLSPGDPR